MFPLTDVKDLNVHTQRVIPNRGNSTDVGLELGFQDLRTIVARRHDAVNRALLMALAILSPLLAILVIRFWRICFGFKEYCRQYGFALRHGMYLQEDLATIYERTRRHYLFKQQEAHEQVRAQGLLQHAIDEGQSRLQFLLEAVQDDPRACRN